MVLAGSASPSFISTSGSSVDVLLGSGAMASRTILLNSGLVAYLDMTASIQACSSAVTWSPEGLFLLVLSLIDFRLAA